MATAFICDGCNRPVTEPKKVGHVTPREYCPECAPRADKFVEAEEALRKGLVEKFVSDRALLISQMSEGGFTLPDIS